MKTIKSLKVTHGYGKAEEKRTLELCYGAINDFSDEDATEFLCVYAPPNDYTPTESSSIAKLKAKGIDVAALAADKEADYRLSANCWISKELDTSLDGIRSKRLIVYETTDKNELLEELDNIFAVINKSKTPEETTDKQPPLKSTTNEQNPLKSTESTEATTDEQNPLKSTEATTDEQKPLKSTEATSLAIPIMDASMGDIQSCEMLTALFYKAVSWQARKLKLSVVKLIVEDEKSVDALAAVFEELAARYNGLTTLDLPCPYSSCASSSNRHVSLLRERGVIPSYLTDRQVFGICVYTSSYYVHMNSILRQNDKKTIAYQELMPLFEATDTALANIQDYHSQAYRTDELSAERLEQHQVGNTVVNLGYSSYSTKTLGKRNSHFTINSQTGSKIWDYSHFPLEKEVLFGRLMTYRIIESDITTNPKKFYVDETPKKI